MNNEILSQIISRFFSGGVKIVLIFITALIVTFLGKRIISKTVSSFANKSIKVINGEKIKGERIETLTGVFNSTFKLIVWITAILTVLPELGINIGPLLAGLGIVGLALGMGARNLIQDYISGIFILLEDHYRIGEQVMISGTKGKIVELNLRRTVVRDEEGGLHNIPNGQVNKSSNFSRK